MTVLRDLLDPPDATEALRSELPREEAPRRDMAGAPLHPEARFVDMTGTSFPEPGRRMGAAPAQARAPASTRGLGGGYAAGLVMLALIVGVLSTTIRNHNPEAASPSTAAHPPAIATRSAP